MKLGTLGIASTILVLSLVVTTAASATQVMNDPGAIMNHKGPRHVGVGRFHPFPIGGIPIAVAVSDLNRDGKMDIAVANVDSSVSILLGKGHGTFHKSIDFKTGGETNNSLAVADLNGDRTPDLAIYGYSSIGQNVRIFLGRGDGAFAVGPTYDTFGRNFVGSLAIADFDADGNEDLVAAGAAHGLYVLRGNGDGTFQPRIPYEVGSAPASVVTGDWNGDGHVDIAVSLAVTDSVSVLMGVGDGTFAPHRTYATGGHGIAMVAADLDHDGRLDLVTANLYGNSISVLPGNGDGTFGPHVDQPVGQFPECIAAGDVNGDGRVDVALGLADVMRTNVLLGNGDGTFGRRFDYLPGIGGVAIADLNRDRGNEVIIGDNDGTGTPGSIVVLPGRPRGGCDDFDDFEGASPRASAVAGIEGDQQEQGRSLPIEWALGQARPNPSRGQALFHLSLPQTAEVTLSTYDVGGRRIGDDVIQRMEAGEHEVAWRPVAAQPGIYFVMVRSDGVLKAKRMVVLVP